MKNKIEVHIMVFIWGFTSILGSVISISALSLTFFRTSLAAFFLFFLFFIQQKRITLPSFIVLRRILLAGFLITLHWFFFFEAIKKANVGIALVGLSSSAFLTSIAEPLYKKIKFQWSQCILGILVILGLYIIFYFETKYSVGLILSVFCALFGALFTVVNTKLVEKKDALSITFFEMLFSSIFCIIFLFISPFNLVLEAPESLKSWIFLLLLSLVCTAYPFYVSIKLLKVFSAFYINLVVNLEILYGILLSIFLLNEHRTMNKEFYIGATIILFSVFMYPFLNKMYNKNNLKNTIKL